MKQNTLRFKNQMVRFFNQPNNALKIFVYNGLQRVLNHFVVQRDGHKKGLNEWSVDINSL